MFVVAGPNGAGKSTYTQGARVLWGLVPIDADAIARETGSDSATAWTEGLRRCRAAIAVKRSFLVETTLAGRNPERPSTYLSLMGEAAANGFRIDLTFIALESPAAHVGRVEDRVNAGLHAIPEDKILARYHLALRRLPDAIRIANHVRVIDNSSVTAPFRPVLEVDEGRLVAISKVLPAWVEGALAGTIGRLIGSGETE
jgi:predicted ABC-type ATPase